MPTAPAPLNGFASGTSHDLDHLQTITYLVLRDVIMDLCANDVVRIQHRQRMLGRKYRTAPTAEHEPHSAGLPSNIYVIK